MAIGILEYLIINNAAQGLLGYKVVRDKEDAKTRAALGQWKQGPEEFPLVDGIVTRLAGKPTPEAMKSAQFQARVARWIVNQKAFEIFLAGLATPGSLIARALPWVTKVGLPRLQSVQSRFAALRGGN
jgi:hypothetical protein